jgi:DNA-binding CsgD family transcriptional regulator
MTASIVQLTESAFNEILSFVAASSRLAGRESLHDSLRELCGRVLHLDEMVIGHCAGAAGTVPTQHCGRFDPVMSLSNAPATLAPSPCASVGSVAGCTRAGALPDSRSAAAPVSHGRVVVCHRRTIERPSLCIVSSAKERAPEELLALLRTLAPYVDDAYHRLQGETDSVLLSAGEPALTGREREVLHWTAEGKGCWETGSIVGISERTVKFHLHNIYRKLNVVNRAQAVAKATRGNLLEARG